MSETEITEIIVKGLEQVTIAVEPRALRRIVTVAQGFPQYAHLLGQYSARAALDSAGDATAIDDSLVLAGMKAAVLHADQSLTDGYFKAVTGTKKNNL